MLIIKRGLPLSKQQVESYFRTWRNLLGGDACKAHELQRALFAHVYDNLSVLDNKTNALIQFNGVLVATYAVVVSVVQFELNLTEALLFTVGVGNAGFAASLCLRVIWVHWSSAAEMEDADSHLKTLLDIRRRRTIYYRRAWSHTWVGLLFLGVFVAFRAAGLEASTLLNLAILAVIAAHLFVTYLYDSLALARTR